jgi:hypothetical protein
MWRPGHGRVVGSPSLRERLQHHGVDNAEDRRAGSDPERKGQDDDSRVGGRSRQVADGELRVAESAHVYDLQSERAMIQCTAALTHSRNSEA